MPEMWRKKITDYNGDRHSCKDIRRRIFGNKGMLWMVNISYTSVYKDNYFPKRFVDKIYSEWKVNGDEYPPLVGGTKGRDYPLAWESYVRDERVTRIEKDGFPNQFCDFIIECTDQEYHPAVYAIIHRGLEGYHQFETPEKLKENVDGIISSIKKYTNS